MKDLQREEREERERKIRQARLDFVQLLLDANLKPEMGFRCGLSSHLF